MKLSMSPRLILLIIAAIFLLPLILAWLMYSGSFQFEPGEGKNFGELVEPPVPVDWHEVRLAENAQGENSSRSDASDILSEHWVVLFPISGECGNSCRSTASSLRQIHLAAGRHRSRMRVALLLGESNSGETESLLRAVYEPFTLIRAPSGELWNSLAEIAPEPSGPSSSGYGTYLIDPLGNIMMRYAADADPNHIKQDLKRLFTWSKLDEQR
jgi:cytochrome oxidase Cu insertion factor (SCO1/SenC/PrrC family)